MMEVNKVTSDFSFEWCAIRSLEINNDIITLNGDEQINLDIHVEQKYLGTVDNVHRGTVLLTLKLVTTRDGMPGDAKINITLEGGFSAPKEMQQEQFEQMMTINGAASLYSVARGRIDAITGTVFVNGKIDIPFVNFIELAEQQDMPEN